ncbi:MAG: hypothetical protein HHAS10_07230 [Candidatus Altimarinota bacterium]
MRSLLLILCFSMILLSSCGSTPETESSSTGSTPTNGPLGKNMDYEAALKNTSSLIKDSDAFRECMAPAVNMCENSVGMRMAQEKKSENICNELSQPANRESCRMTVVSMIAEDKKDMNLCNSLSGDSQVYCKTQYIRRDAMNKKSVEACKQMSDILGKGTNSGEAKMYVQHNEVDQCILEVINTSDTATSENCDVIRDEMTKKICIDTVKQRAEMRKYMSERNLPNSSEPTHN